jgi:predicted transcriptional regulator
MKRARMKGASHFVNVNLDRDTKRRLKLAAFNTDTSMQAIMEKAIRQYLDTNGF